VQLPGSSAQWRRQDLLRGGAKLEIRSWGTHGKLQGSSSWLMTNSFVTNAVGLLIVVIECELLTFALADLADYTIFGCQF